MLGLMLLLQVLAAAAPAATRDAGGSPARAPGGAPGPALVVAVSGPPGSAEYLPVHLAAAAGDFERAGLTVTVTTTRSAAAAAEALARGEADVAVTSLEALLRFGRQSPGPPPRLVFGLTAAPPVALVGTGRPRGGPPAAPAAPDLAAIERLRGRRIGVRAPGAPELAWLHGLLERAHLRAPQVEMVSLGSRGAAGAMERGEVQAALVDAALAGRLVADGQVRRLADLASPGAVAAALGRPTVNAAVFVRADRPPADRDLAALVRAVLAAERRLAEATPEALAAVLPAEVVGLPDEFAAVVATARALYLPGGRVTAGQVAETLRLIGLRLPLPPPQPVPARLLRLVAPAPPGER